MITFRQASISVSLVALACYAMGFAVGRYPDGVRRAWAAWRESSRERCPVDMTCTAKK